MEAEKRYRGPRLPVVCAECEDELDLSRSGHQFCTNRLCKDGSMSGRIGDLCRYQTF
jgi:hypothetical protein